MKTLDYVIAQEPPFANPFYRWLCEVRDIAGGDTAVDDATIALAVQAQKTA